MTEPTDDPLAAAAEYERLGYQEHVDDGTAPPIEGYAE